MLGLLQRVRLGLAPAPLMALFPRQPRPIYSYGVGSLRPRHDHQLFDPIGRNSSPMLSRSVFGLIRVYNDLPDDVVNSCTVKVFQRRLQNIVKDYVATRPASWERVFPRVFNDVLVLIIGYER